jgi:hypothetical protein
VRSEHPIRASQFAHRALSFAGSGDVDGGELFQRPLGKRTRVRSSSDGEQVRAGGLGGPAGFRRGVDLVRHGGHAKNLRVESVKMIDDILVAQRRVAGVQDGDFVSVLQQDCRDVGETQVADRRPCALGFCPRPAGGVV